MSVPITEEMDGSLFEENTGKKGWLGFASDGFTFWEDDDGLNREYPNLTGG